MQNLVELYLKIRNPIKGIGKTWDRNSTINRQFIMADLSPEQIVKIFTAKVDFSIDGFVFWKECQELIKPATDWLSQHYPNVVFSPISKYFNTEVVTDGLSVNHCQMNIIRSIIDDFKNLSNCKSIIEIGPGYGALPREILLKNDKIKYVIIDLPESIICSYSYLSLEFPNKTHLVITSEEDTKKDFDILYVPVKFLDTFLKSKMIHQFDLFINTCSMGEMTNDIVRNYYNIVTNILDVKSVYWLNRFLDNGSQTENSNACAVEIPKKWHIKHWKQIPTYMQCPYIMNYHAKYVELYADIQQIDDSIEKEIDSDDLLFCLWNCNRLQPNRNSLIRIIDEIEKILPTSVELVYYRNLLKNITT